MSSFEIKTEPASSSPPSETAEGIDMQCTTGVSEVKTESTILQQSPKSSTSSSPPPAIRIKTELQKRRASTSTSSGTSSGSGSFSPMKLQRPARDNPYAHLRTSGMLADFTLTCDGDNSFPVHKCVLAVSSDFLSHIFLQDVEYIELQGFSKDTVESLLQFVYEGSVEGLTPEAVDELFRLAGKLQINGLDQSSIEDDKGKVKATDCNSCKSRYGMLSTMNNKDLKAMGVKTAQPKLDIEYVLVKDNDYACNYCLKSMRGLANIRNHVDVHTGNATLLQCLFSCGYESNNKSNMKRHCVTVHGITGVHVVALWKAKHETEKNGEEESPMRKKIKKE